MASSKKFSAEGEQHRVYKRGSKVFVDHTEKKGGKNDVIDLTKKAGSKTVKEGVKAVKKYHSKDTKKGK